MKYRLKKDLWGKKAGEIVEPVEYFKYVIWNYHDMSITVCILNSEYFEEVKEQKEPREFFINEYSNGLSGIIYNSREQAIRNQASAGREYIGTVRLIEVEEKGKDIMNPDKNSSVGDVGNLAFNKELYLFEEAFAKDGVKVFSSLEEFRNNIPLHIRINPLNKLTKIR